MNCESYIELLLLFSLSNEIRSFPEPSHGDLYLTKRSMVYIKEFCSDVLNVLTNV